jgi:hypothetical protein
MIRALTQSSLRGDLNQLHVVDVTTHPYGRRGPARPTAPEGGAELTSYVSYECIDTGFCYYQHRH